MGAVRRLAVALSLSLAAGGVLAACELVAGIEDIALTGDGGSRGAADVTLPRDSSGGGSSDDAGTGPSLVPAADGDEGAQGADVGQAVVGVDGTLPVADGMAEAGAEAGVESEGGGSPDGGLGQAADAGDAGDAGDAADGGVGDASDAEAGLLLELIDDMEAHNGLIPRVGGRDGEWYPFNDKTDGGLETFGEFAINPPRGTSTYAARMYGSGFTQWGEGMGFNINSPTAGPMTGQRLTYDASPYRGFYFWGRSTSGASIRVGLTVPDRNTDPSGGVCTSCGDHFATSVTLTSTWTAFAIDYTELKQAGWGAPQEAALDTAHIYGVSFIAVAAPTFDVWVDDIYFILP